MIIRITYRDGTTQVVWCSWARTADDVDLALAEHTGSLRIGPDHGPGAGWIMLDDVRRMTAIGYSTVKPTDVDDDTE